MDKPYQPKILIAIPAHNHERTIGSIVLKARQYADEVIVIDDGSRDGTSRIALLAGAIVLRHEKKKGKGASIQSILAEAKRRNPDSLVLLDAGFQHNLDEIPNLVKPILEGYDLVIGSRELEKHKTPWYCHIGRKVLTHSARILLGQRLSDLQSGFMAFSSKAVAELRLRQNSFAVETEMIIAAVTKGLKVKEVPVSYTESDSTSNNIKSRRGERASL